MLGSLILLSSVLNVVCFHNQCSVFLFWRCWKQSMIGCVWYLLLTFLIWLFLEQLERGLISKDTDFSDKFQPNSRHDGYYFQFDYSYKLILFSIWLFIQVILIYLTCIWYSPLKDFWSSYRNLAWVGFEPKTTEFL